MTIDRKAETLRRVLFLGEQNFHASRFCEELFNSFARTEGLNWQATSRSLLPAPASRHIEPMSPQAIACLRRLGAAPVNHARLPLEVTDFDIQMSDSVIGVGLQAKRSMLIERWPDYASQIELWTAETRGGGEPELLRLAAELRLLLATLGEHRRYGAQSQSQVPPAGLPRVRAVGAPAAGR